MEAMKGSNLGPRLKRSLGQADPPQLPERDDPVLDICEPSNRPNPSPMGRFPTVSVTFRPVGGLLRAGH
jgi:hypothetical protein